MNARPVVMALALAAGCARALTPEAKAEAVRQCAILAGSPERREFLVCLVDRFKWPTDSAAAFVADTMKVIQAEIETKREWADLRAALRNYVTAQEAYFSEHNVYASKSTELSDFTPGLVVIRASQAGHRAEIKGRSWHCVIWVGSPSFKEDLLVGEGDPQCNET